MQVFSGVLSLLALASVAAEDVVFTRQGVAAVPATYGFLVFDVSDEDLRSLYTKRAKSVTEAYKRFVTSQVRLELNVACIGLSDRCASERKQAGGHTGAEVAEYSRELDAIYSQVNLTTEELIDTVFSSGTSVDPFNARPKRNPLAIVGGISGMVSLGISVRNAVELHELRGELDVERTRTDHLFLVTESLSRTVLRDEKMVQNVVRQVARNGEAMETLEAHEVFLEHKIALRSILEETSRGTSAFYSLFAGRLDPVLLNFTALRDAYSEFQIQAHKAGMRTVFPKPEVILRQDVSFWPRGRSIVFALAVPLMPANEELLSVFKLEEDVPTAVPVGNSTVEVLWLSRHTYIAVDPDRNHHYALTKDQWRDCDRMAGVAVCPNIRMRYEGFEATCVGALYKARVSSASKTAALKHCEVTTRKNPAVYIAEVSPGVVRVNSGKEIVAWRLVCPGSREPNITATNGSQFLAVPHGCSLAGLDVTYKVMPMGPRVERNYHLVSWSTELPTSWTRKFNNLVNVSRLLQDADIWKKANDLEAEFRHHVLAQTVASNAYYGTIGVGAIFFLGLLVALLIVSQVLLWRAVKRASETGVRGVTLGALKQTAPPSSSSDASDEEEEKRKRRRRARRKNKDASKTDASTKADSLMIRKTGSLHSIAPVLPK